MSHPSQPDIPPVQVNKWLLAISVMLGAFIAVMDISVVNVAMPHMMGTFSEDLSTITWVATAYSIAEIIMISLSGWLSTLIGRKRLYLWSFAIFTLGSILCGTAHTFHQMLFYRILQGIGGGALIPVSQAILRENFSQKEQGMAMAIFGMGVVLAPALGPVVGGWLTDHYGWPWIFYINLPVSIVGMIMVWTFVHDPAYLKRGVKKIDWLGVLLLSVALTTMQIVFERGEHENWFESRMIIIGTLACISSLLFLVYWELKTEEPVINFRLLKNKSLTLGSIMGLVFGIALFGTTFILPQFTQTLLGYPALKAGLVMAPRAMMLLLFMPVAGKLYNVINSRMLVLIGIVITFGSYYELSKLSLDSGYWNLIPTLMVMGMGMPFIFVTLSTVSLATIPRPSMTDATSIYTLTRRVGGNIGYALAATIVSHSRQVHHAVLASHVTPLNPMYSDFTQKTAQFLGQSGLSPNDVSHTTLVLANMMVNRQAVMLAYNDSALIFGVMFLFTIPIALMLPGRKKK
ncbi:MAG: DHA2 family efflux MFS transporter permease subunit [Proteobacteria bacterium]|nr:DHA2 family efflux MFS transporter permease subunit [Pseudomonadota bacterium]